MRREESPRTPPPSSARILGMCFNSGAFPGFVSDHPLIMSYLQQVGQSSLSPMLPSKAVGLENGFDGRWLVQEFGTGSSVMRTKRSVAKVRDDTEGVWQCGAAGRNGNASN